MPGTIDILTQEKALAAAATRALSSGLKSEIRKTTNTQSGQAVKISAAGSQFKHNRLQRIKIKAPHYVFKQNYGFEGTKSNGVNMRLRQTSVIENAISQGNVLETLADGLSNLRLDQVAAIIQFPKNGK